MGKILKKKFNFSDNLYIFFSIFRKPTSMHLENPNMWKPYQENNSFLQIGNIKNNFEPTVTVENNYLPNRMNFWKANFPLL